MVWKAPLVQGCRIEVVRGRLLRRWWQSHRKGVIDIGTKLGTWVTQVPSRKGGKLPVGDFDDRSIISGLLQRQEKTGELAALGR